MVRGKNTHPGSFTPSRACCGIFKDYSAEPSGNPASDTEP